MYTKYMDAKRHNYYDRTKNYTVKLKPHNARRHCG